MPVREWTAARRLPPRLFAALGLGTLLTAGAWLFLGSETAGRGSRFASASESPASTSQPETSTRAGLAAAPFDSTGDAAGNSADLRDVLPGGRTAAGTTGPQAPGPIAALPLPVNPPDSARGRLVDLAGRGLSRFRVHAAPLEGASAAERVAVVLTDASGAFEFPFEVQGLDRRSANWTARGPRFTPSCEWPLAARVRPGRQPERRFVLPLTRLIITARTYDGRPMPVATDIRTFRPSRIPAKSYVRVEAADRSGWFHELGEEEQGAPWLSSDAQLVVLVEVDRVYRLTLHGWDHGSATRDVYVPDTSEDLLVELRAPPRELPVAVELTLETDAGAPYAGGLNWDLTAVGRTASYALGIEGATNGTAVLQLPPGPYDVQACLVRVKARSGPLLDGDAGRFRAPAAQRIEVTRAAGQRVVLVVRSAPPTANERPDITDSRPELGWTSSARLED